MCVCVVVVLAVCQGISNRLSLIGTNDNHYANMVRTYRNCTVVLENLEITYMEEHRDLSFLRVKDTVGFFFFGFLWSWLESRSHNNPELSTSSWRLGRRLEPPRTPLQRLASSRQLSSSGTGVILLFTEHLSF